MVISCGSPSEVFIQPPDHEKIAYDYASNTIPKLFLQTYDGGTELTWDLNSFDYNEYKDEYTLDITMDWCGATTAKCSYSASGELRIIVGSRPIWKAYYHSSDLEIYLKLRRYIDIAAGAAVIIDMIVENKD